MEACPECCAPISADSPGGLCIPCMLRLAQLTSAASDSVTGGVPASKPRMLGDYVLLREIGRGGMGVVYEARQRLLNRHVALKLLLEGEFANESAVKRFEVEAEAAATLDHPNIVSLYEIGQHEARPYLAMKLIDGCDLGRLLNEYTLPSPRPSDGRSPRLRNDSPSAPAISKAELRQRQCQIACLLSKVARAVHFAHQRGILHRDLKPSNILIDSAGEPHVTDFGLAKHVSEDGRLTGTGMLLGSPFYMAPEQAVGDSRQLSTAADIYSLGVILFELLTGELPFKAATTVSTLRLLTDAQPPSPTSINPHVHADLETICLKCLAKAPDRRYGSAAALAEDLDRWVRCEPIAARPATHWERILTRVRRNPVRSAVVGIALLAVLLSGTFLYASARTYVWLMGKINEEHLIVPPERDGVYHLALKSFADERCSFNFWKVPFCERPQPLVSDKYNERYGRIELTNFPPDLAEKLRVRIYADIPGLPDPPKTPALTNGQVFLLAHSSRQERAFYIGSVNFRASNVLAQAADAGFNIQLLGRPGEPEPLKPRALDPHFRY